MNALQESLILVVKKPTPQLDEAEQNSLSKQPGHLCVFLDKLGPQARRQWADCIISRWLKHDGENNPKYGPRSEKQNHDRALHGPPHTTM